MPGAESYTIGYHKRTTAVATDDRRWQRMTAGGRRAADDVRQTTRGSNAVPALSLNRPRAATGSVARHIDLALLGSIWRGCSVVLRTGTTQSETASE